MVVFGGEGPEIPLFTSTSVPPGNCTGRGVWGPSQVPDLQCLNWPTLFAFSLLGPQACLTATAAASVLSSATPVMALEEVFPLAPSVSIATAGPGHHAALAFKLGVCLPAQLKQCQKGLNAPLGGFVRIAGFPTHHPHWGSSV